MAMPLTGFLSGTPASIQGAATMPQTEAMDEEPLLSVISETSRSV